MPETPEIPLEVPQTADFLIGPVGTVVIFSLAAYGAVEASRNTFSKAKQIIADRKTKKAEKQAVEANNPPTQ